MIPLHKGPEPQVLTQNAIQWTDAVMSKIGSGLEPTPVERSRYRHPQVKAALIAETHGKCAYCESKLLHVHHGDVEHIFPKSLDPARTFLWENLTIACEICNQNKSNKDPYFEFILDPYSSDPSTHLMFAGPLVFPLGTSYGLNTRTILDLNRAELAERRRDHLERMMAILNTISRHDLPITVRRALYEDFATREASDSGQYSAMVRAVLNQVKPSLSLEVTGPLS